VSFAGTVVGTPIEARWYCPTCDRLVDHEPNHAEVHFV
jgi:hypothetical protein